MVTVRMYRLYRLSYQCVRGGIEAPTSVSLIKARRQLYDIRSLRRTTITRGKFACNFYTAIGGPPPCVFRASGLTMVLAYPLVLKEKTGY